MREIKVTRGVPASGKSTWAKEWVAEDPSNRARVNRDDLRDMLGVTGGVGTNEQERMVSALEEQIVKALLFKGMDVVVDATHLKAQFAKRWFQFSNNVMFVDFPISYGDALARDIYRRQDGKRHVGAEVIQKFFDRYQINKATGALPKAPVRAADTVLYKAYEPDPTLPKAIIVDIDGTLAHSTGRGPYDTSGYHLDDHDEVIRDIVSDHFHAGYRVLVTSGRDVEFYEVTAKWLDDHGIEFDELIMRNQGDIRNDSIVKDELFETRIATRFNVRFALDDRNRVVDMWRAKGIKTLQVQPGDF